MSQVLVLVVALFALPKDPTLVWEAKLPVVAEVAAVRQVELWGH
jgi:hypothetical protein